MWGSPDADNSSQINVTHSPDKDFLETEPPNDKNISLEDDVGESSLSSYDDPSMMRLYNETNRQLTLLHSSTNSRQAVPDSLDLWNRVILEDTQSTATISDMDNDLDWDDCSAGVAISSDGQAQGYMAEGSEPETRFSVRHLEPWGVEYQEANQVDWELPASPEQSRDPPANEYHSLNEGSGQLIANNIWDSVMRDNDMSSLMLPGPSYVTDSEQHKSPPETPNSSEKSKDGSIPEVLEASGANESGALDPEKQNTGRGTLPSDAASWATTLENPGHFAHSDPWEGPSYGQSEGEEEARGAVARERLSEEEMLDRASGISGKGPSDGEHSSPVASQHQEICDESGKVSSLSLTSSPQTEEPQEVLEHERGSYNPDPCDGHTEVSTNDPQAQETCEKHLMYHRNSGETTEISGGLNLTKTVSLPEMDLEKTEKCNVLEPERVNQEPPHECPQSLDIWDASVDSDVQVNLPSSEITKDLEVESTEDNLPGAIPSGNYRRDSISSEYTHSSASSPGLYDSSAALPSWDQRPNTGHQEQHQDDWSQQNHQESALITTDSQVEVIAEMKDLEKTRMDRLEKSLDHKVPKFLEIWNDSIDGDSFSSLSSPETGKYSEYSDAYQEGNLVVSHQEKNDHDISKTVQPEDARFTATSSGSDDDSIGDEESVEREIHLGTCQAAQSEPGAWDSLNEPNKFLATADPNDEFSAYGGGSEPTENKSTPFCDNQQNSPDHWNLSPLKETELQITAVDKEMRSLETANTGDTPWQISPQSESKNENYSKLEMLGFSAESTEWWNASLQGGRPIESAFERELPSSSTVLEMSSSVYQNVSPWGAPVQGDTKPMETQCTNPFTEEHQSPFLDSNENSHEQLWNIQPRQPDPEVDQLSQLIILDQIKEKDSREQSFVSSAGQELTPETPNQEQQCQNTMLSVWDQPDPTFTHTDENGCVISNVSTVECQETNWWEEGKSYPGEITNSTIASDFPAVSSPTQLIKKSSSEQNCKKDKILSMVTNLPY